MKNVIDEMNDKKIFNAVMEHLKKPIKFNESVEIIMSYLDVIELAVKKSQQLKTKKQNEQQRQRQHKKTNRRKKVLKKLR